jgi:bifunctional N-acetylglucosamine-1-phosphate-uridyltransferase/glucosamine-1-phosphate-acetyltransferase GlmU-like protein
LTDTNNRFIGIVEEADATDAQKKIRVINSGIYCVEREFLAEALHKINTDNAQGELYLTDIIAVGSRDKKKVGVLIAGEEAEFYGINSRQDLIAVENLMRDRRGNKS